MATQVDSVCVNARDGALEPSLTHLHAAGVECVVAFLRSNYATSRTFAAASPQLRRMSEAALQGSTHDKDFVRAQRTHDRWTYVVAASAQHIDKQHTLAHSLWWAERSQWPLVLRIDNERKDVISSLSAGAQQLVEEIVIKIGSEDSCRDNSAHEGNEQCNTPLCALHHFTNLKHFSIECKGPAKNNTVVNAAVQRTLLNAADLAIYNVELKGCNQLTKLSSLATFTSISKIVAHDCGIEALDALAQCAALMELDVSRNFTLKSLAPLAGAYRLEKLTAAECGLTSLDGLGNCQRLRKLNVSDNAFLETLSGLAGAPSLEKLTAKHCLLHNLDGLGSCPQLTDVNVLQNAFLEDVRGIAGAPSLERLRAKRCCLRNVIGLGNCPSLKAVDVSKNLSLTDLQGLAGTPRLEKLTAHWCSLNSVDGLSSCPRLQEVDMSFNTTLHDVSGLSASQSLRRLILIGCSVTNANMLSELVSVRMTF